MTEPKIDAREGICGDRSPTFGGSSPAICTLGHGHPSGWHQDDGSTPPQRWTYGWDAPTSRTELSRLRAENAGLREALEASQAECAKVIEERDEALERIDRWRIELRDARNDLLNIRGILSPNGGDRVVPDDVPMAPAVEWLVAERDALRRELAEIQELFDVGSADRVRAVVEAAIAWHARVADDPRLWADGEDVVLLAAVDSYTQSSNPGETS